MGFWSALGLFTAASDLALSPVSSPATLQSVPADVAAAFGINTPGSDYVTRKEAMSVPAVKRARNVIAGTLGTLPLIALRGQSERVPRALCEQPDPNTTPQWHLTYTFDDLIFYGIAWWQVTGRDATSYPTSVRRIPVPEVSVDTRTGGVAFYGLPQDAADVIRFDGPEEGLLADGGRTLRTAIMLEEAVRKFARLDVPLGVLKAATGSPNLSPEEVAELLTSWETHRRTRTTAYLNQSIDYETVALDADRIQLGASRSEQNAEIARLLNLPGRYVGAGSGDSMTYSNSESERRDLIDLSLGQWRTAVEQRLSMPDVTPRGQVIRLDAATFVQGDTATAMDTATKAIDAGVLEPDEVRADLFNRAPLNRPAAPAARPALEVV